MKFSCHLGGARQLFNQDFLCLSLLELMKVTGQSYWNVQKLLCKVSLACAPKMQTAYEMKMKRAINPSSAFLSTTLDGLDKALHGGVACGSLTEVTGPSGCGKTQFCLMMSVLATLPISMGGLDGAVIYIDTESAFGAERLVEIAEHRFPNYFGTEEKLFSMTRSIHLYRELTCDSVLKRIETLEEEIIAKKVKLVIIDSVASVVRKEFDMKLQGNLMERSNFLAREASLLKYLAEEFSIPIFQILFQILANFSPTMITALFVSIGSGPVLDDSSHLLGFIKCRDNALQQIHQVILTNQITTRLSNGLDIQADQVSPADDLSLSEVSGASGSKEREPGYVTAALGNTWSHSVNTRLILQYHDLHTRQVLVAKSPIAPFSAFFYTIENSGLVLQDLRVQVGHGKPRWRSGDRRWKGPPRCQLGRLQSCTAGHKSEDQYLERWLPQFHCSDPRASTTHMKKNVSQLERSTTQIFCQM
ncbi:DNA repair protein RAD51 homolog 2 isoform X2 [Mauremys mutica]|uniref:DNA repair protein RAD51 homolog 2 isoform X2 n=1 Tax=Mauremys mutica TaxID=74926 RepID=UPI001D167A63|nr:DNA repair protein RAD51 homolog 2 isoform X2 [Mauremys mutica]